MTGAVPSDSVAALCRLSDSQGDSSSVSYECSTSDNEGQQPALVTKAGSRSFVVATSPKNDRVPGLVTTRTLFINARQKTGEVSSCFRQSLLLTQHFKDMLKLFMFYIIDYCILFDVACNI